MKIRKWVLLALLSVLVIGSAFAGALEPRTFILFGGSDVDSTEQVSPWIPVRDAQRITLRTWSTRLAAGINADTTFTDSIAVFKVAFSDSVSGRTAGPSGEFYPVAQDSVVITAATVANIDTTTKMMGLFHPPIQEALRAPGNGSGIVSWVIPISVGLATADNNGFIVPQYMRVYVTPTRRNTPGGQLSTQGKRTNGLRGLRMQARVIYGNK